MKAHETAALQAISAAYEEPVSYTGAGLVAAEIMAVRSDSAALPFQGPGATTREISFEIAQAALPERPRKGNIIEPDGERWKVNDITRRNDVAAWVLIVEEAPLP